MRAFVVLCLVAAAAAQYDYTPHSGGVGSIGSDGGSVGGSYGGSLGGGSLGGGSLGGGSLGGGSLGGGSIGGGSLGGGSIGDGSLGGGSLEQIQPASEYNKEFYSYTAPEGEFNDAGLNDQIANSLKKALRVVFIKGPENNGLENAALQLAKSAADSRTAIYVLNKQADIGDLANKLNAINKNNAQKPEVHFVKYRTPADAENAQRAIQSQYDSLPGASNSHNGGAAPVLDFASKAPVRSAPASSAPTSSYIPPQASYLPPGRRF